MSDAQSARIRRVLYDRSAPTSISKGNSLKRKSSIIISADWFPPLTHLTALSLSTRRFRQSPPMIPIYPIYCCYSVLYWTTNIPRNLRLLRVPPQDHQGTRTFTINTKQQQSRMKWEISAVPAGKYSLFSQTTGNQFKLEITLPYKIMCGVVRFSFRSFVGCGAVNISTWPRVGVGLAAAAQSAGYRT